METTYTEIIKSGNYIATDGDRDYTDLVVMNMGFCYVIVSPQHKRAWNDQGAPMLYDLQPKVLTVKRTKPSQINEDSPRDWVLVSKFYGLSFVHTNKTKQQMQKLNIKDCAIYELGKKLC